MHGTSGSTYTICVITQIEELPSEAQIDSAVETLKLLADPTRLRILWALLQAEHAVTPLAESIGAQPAAVSQHLAKLRLARLVRTRREGNRVFYLAENSHVRRLVEEALFHADHVTNDEPAHQAEAQRRRPRPRSA